MQYAVIRVKKNIKQIGRTYEQNIEADYLQKLETGYWEYLKQLIDAKILVIDTNQIDFVNNVEDYDKLLALIQSDFEPGIHRLVL